MAIYSIGLDFGTNSVRAVVVDSADGRELGSAVFSYADGDMGVVTDPKDPHVARQHPVDYLQGSPPFLPLGRAKPPLLSPQRSPPSSPPQKQISSNHPPGPSRENH